MQIKLKDVIDLFLNIIFVLCIEIFEARRIIGLKHWLRFDCSEKYLKHIWCVIKIVCLLFFLFLLCLFLLFFCLFLWILIFQIIISTLLDGIIGLILRLNLTNCGSLLLEIIFNWSFGCQWIASLWRLGSLSC